MTEVDAYPLSWPATWPRTKHPQSARFDTSPAKARQSLYRELELMGVRRSSIIVSSNAVLNRNGELSARQPKIADPGVAVYFVRDGESKCIPCDKWDRIEDNVQAVVKTVNALRGLERWGAKTMVDAAFQGFAALPSGASAASCWDVLGIAPTRDRSAIDAHYRAWVRTNHPDVGGDHDAFIVMKGAYEQAVSEVTP